MGKPRVNISKAKFVELYVIEKKTGLEVARFFGIGRSTVSRYIKEYGLVARGISEVRKDKFWGPSDVQREKLRKLAKGQTGINNPTWKGGQSKTREGYRLILVNGRYIKEHRLVMERELGRKLKRNEEVHHLDQNKLNNDPANLVVLSKSHHARLHWSSPARRENQSEKMQKAYDEYKVLDWQVRKGRKGSQLTDTH
jgi:hypothetical protein